jgi:hypothetical protein
MSREKSKRRPVPAGRNCVVVLGGEPDDKPTQAVFGFLGGLLKDR